MNRFFFHHMNGNDIIKIFIYYLLNPGEESEEDTVRNVVESVKEADVSHFPESLTQSLFYISNHPQPISHYDLHSWACDLCYKSWQSNSIGVINVQSGVCASVCLYVCERRCVCVSGCEFVREGINGGMQSKGQFICLFVCMRTHFSGLRFFSDDAHTAQCVPIWCVCMMCLLPSMMHAVCMHHAHATLYVTIWRVCMTRHTFDNGPWR